LLLLGASGVARAAEAVCYDSAALPFSQKSRRRAVSYQDQSDDPARHCGICAFFTGTAAGCGTCAILTGPVNATGVCASWAPKAPAKTAP
jgi:hypothetical protein